MEDTMEAKMNRKRKKWIYFLRQLMVASGVWTMFFMVAQSIGAPTVIIPQLRKNSIEPLDDETASWMYSVIGVATVPWTFILSALTRVYGLRTTHIIACLILLVSYMIFYFSTTPLQIIISEIVLAISNAGTMAVGIVIVTEYSSPEYRGIFLTIKSASFSWGLWSANAIGTFFHWKYIAYSGFLCSAYTFTFVFWPESPHWLASKGRVDECRKAYYWLRGHDEKSEKELEVLITARVKAEKNAEPNNDWRNISSAVRTVKSMEFYGPFFLTILLITQYYFSGKVVCTIYVIDILKKMSGSESAAYVGMLILDGVSLFSMYFGCYLSKILQRRTLFFTSSCMGIIFLFIISIYLYLVKLGIMGESKAISIVLLTCYTIAICCGPMIMNTSIYAELIPFRFKTVLVPTAAVTFFLYSTTLLKVAPYLFKRLGLHGFFLFYGIIFTTCTALLYKYLPETKDKTLQEIEGNFKTCSKSQQSRVVSTETERLNSCVNID